MIVIDEVAALKGLRRAVELKGPDHRSDSVYTRLDHTTGTYVCHCIVGTALAHLGIASSVMAECGNFLPFCSLAVIISRRHDIEITSGATSILDEAQIVQDGGDSWGAALRSAELLAACSPVPREQDE